MTKDATDIALSFYYQGCYALIALLDACDDAAGIAVETYDDVVIEALSLKTLAQLKHKAAPLSVKSDDFWKAVANWAPHIGDSSIRFRFVLTSRLPDNSILRLLDKSEHCASICEALWKEASRVCAAKLAAEGAEPFKRRLPGCKAFLALSHQQQMTFVERLDIHDGSFDVSNYETQVKGRLTLVPRANRDQIGARLIEWWDRQVALALSSKRSRILRKDEVVNTIAENNKLFFSDRLPDDFADRQPPDKLEETPVLVRQIELIDGSPFWINQAKLERWKARGQRDSWLSEQISVAERLIRFDKGLITEWRLRFEPLSNNGKVEDEAEKRQGRTVFDWAFKNAWLEVPPIQPEWKTPYLVRGSYQELANRQLVGWHPRFRELLSGGNDEDPGNE